MKLNQNTTLLVSLLLVGLCLSAQAAEENAVSASGNAAYVGLESQAINHTFEPGYRFANGSPNTNYTNNSYGFGLNLLAGYTFDLSDLTSLAVQVHGGGNNLSWDLNLPAPGHIKYEIPYTYGLSLLPSLRVSDKFSLVAEVGFNRGYIRQQKSTVSQTEGLYNFTQWTNGYTLGAGVMYDFNQKWHFSLLYHRTAYNKFSYDTHLQNGARAETVRDAPRVSSVGLSVTYSFGK